MRIEAVQQRRLHRAAPDLPLVETTGADVRPGLDRPVALGGPVDQHRARLVEGDAPADQVVGDAGLDRELPGRVVDAGDADPLLGDHPPGDVLGDCRAISGLIAGPQLRCAIHSGRRLAAAGTIGRRRHGDFRGVSGHGFLLRLHGCVGVCGGAGLGRRVRLVHGCGLRLMGGGRPGDEPARNEVLTLAKAGAAIGADRHRRQLHRLPVDRPPDRHLAVLLDHLVGADGVADRDVADDPGADVLPERLHVLAL